MTTKVTSSDHCSSPDELRKLADADDGLVHLLALGVPPLLVESLRRQLRTFADAWDKQLHDMMFIVNGQAEELIVLRQRLEAAEKYRASLDEWAEMAYLYLADRRGKGERMMMKQLEHIHLRFAALAGEEK